MSAIMKLWQFAVNQFLNGTKANYKKALILSTAHDAYLKQMTIDFPGDPDWTTLYNRYHPLHLAYKSAYNAWVASGGTLKSKTLSLNALLKLIPEQLDLWIAQIIPFHAKSSTRFVELFPNGRKPFEKGKTEAKINAVSSLSTAIGAEVDLAPTKLLVDTAYTGLDDARTAQQGKKTSKSTGSEAVETARVAAMQMQYADTGFLMNKYYLTPEKIQPFFDLRTLRTNFQSFFTRKMKLTETSKIVERTFSATDEIRMRIKDVGNTTDKATLYLGSTPGGINSTGVSVINNNQHKFPVTQFGVADFAVNKYLTLVTAGNINVLEVDMEMY